jgi:hypothetical protein
VFAEISTMHANNVLTRSAQNGGQSARWSAKVGCCCAAQKMLVLPSHFSFQTIFDPSLSWQMLARFIVLETVAHKRRVVFLLPHIKAAPAREQ